MVIRELARVVPTPPGRSARAEAAQGQERARRLALRPGTWDRQEAAAMRAGSGALGEGAPFFVPADIAAEAMTAATGRPWDAVCSQAHWGNWAVLRPADPPPASV